MRDALAATGLQELDRVRARTGSISRASVARLADVNPVQLWRGLDGRAATRLSTVERTGVALLTRMIEETNQKGRIVAGSVFQHVVMVAARDLAFTVGKALAMKEIRGQRRQRLDRALAAHDKALSHLVADHYRIEFALAHLVHAWLSGDKSEGLRLALVGACAAIVTRETVDA